MHVTASQPKNKHYYTVFVMGDFDCVILALVMLRKAKMFAAELHHFLLCMLCTVSHAFVQCVHAVV